jgi:hypothetical protein
MPRPTGPFTTFCTTTMWVHEGTEIVESVSRHQACRHKFPQSVLDLSRQMVGHANQIAEKTGAMVL